MPPETQARAFDPFFTTKPAGHGLGLSIVHGIVHGLHGAIRVLSDSGTGTTFQILLPRAEGMARNLGEKAAASRDSGGQQLHATVLVVEDENSLRQPVVTALRRAGLEVLEAADGSAAINLVRAHAGHIDLIILDMTIPGASSRDVIVESARAWPGTRLILTSAYSREMLADALSAPQVHNFVRKPFLLADLLAVIRTALEAQEPPLSAAG